MSPGAWRLLQDPPGSAAWNMSLDEALLLTARERRPTLRLYTWREPAVSLGYRQKTPDWLKRCSALGVDPVRRITGGGSVLHERDLTYAVIAPRATAELPDDLTGSYRWIQAVLIQGLQKAGLDARPSSAVPGAERSAICFSGSTGSEIDLERAKLVGSAQRRTAWGLLQHGSIRLDDDSALYRELFGVSPPPLPALPRASQDTLASAIAEAFAAALAGRLEPGELTSEELDLALARQQPRLRDSLAMPPGP